MSRGDRNAALAAAIILLGFGLFAFYLPVIMRAAVGISQLAAIAVVVVFLAALFVILWLRSRSQHRG